MTQASRETRTVEDTGLVGASHASESRVDRFENGAAAQLRLTGMIAVTLAVGAAILARESLGLDPSGVWIAAVLFVAAIVLGRRARRRAHAQLTAGQVARGLEPRAARRLANRVLGKWIAEP